MQGSCLCGAIQVNAEDHHEINACHCSMCRRWGGGPLLAVHCEPNVRFTGDVRSYRSSEWAERGFCPTCGTHLFYRLLQTGEYILGAGLFEPGQDFVMTGQIFIDEKPGYYAFANETPTLTGTEVFAQFAPAEGGAAT